MPRVPVTNSSTEIATVPSQGGGRSDALARRFLIKNKTGTEAVFLEVGSAAAVATSFEWELTDGPLEIELEPGEALNGIVATNAQTVHVLGQGR